MKLIREISEDIEYLAETDAAGEKHHYIHGVFLQSGIKNKNGRIYEMHVMEPAVNKYLIERVQDNRGYGELGHPPGPQINLDRVSHMVTELRKDGANFIGKARLTDTPMGKIAEGLMKSGAKLGVSSRGMGSLVEDKKTGAMLVQGDYRIVTAADIVADPSAPDAFVSGLMESAEWIFDPVQGTWKEESAYDLQSRVRGMSKAKIDVSKAAIFESYLQTLVSKA